MIDHEERDFYEISVRVREKYPNVYMTNSRHNETPPRFPCVRVSLESNTVNRQYSTFDKLENVARNNYYVEIFAIGGDGFEICKDIASIVDEYFQSIWFVRTMDQPTENKDNTISRRIMRFQNSNVI